MGFSVIKGTAEPVPAADVTVTAPMDVFLVVKVATRVVLVFIDQIVSRPFYAI